jgi:hypothetical protein
MWLLTYQTNIYRDVSSGLVRMLVMNCAIALRIRSDSFTWYSSQMVVMFSLRVNGIRKQVWYGCFVILGSPYYLWVVVKVPCILVRSSGRVTLDCLTFINASFIYSSLCALDDWWNAFDSRFTCRESISFCWDVLSCRFCSLRIDTSRDTSGSSVIFIHLFIRMGFQSIREEYTFSRDPILFRFLAWFLLLDLLGDSRKSEVWRGCVWMWLIWNHISIRQIPFWSDFC